MKKSIKAALLSALVFPGLGQVQLKRYVRGLVLMALTLTGLGVLIVRTAGRALRMIDQLQTQDRIMDPGAVSNLVSGSSLEGDPYFSLISLGIAACWLFSVIDAYRLGKEEERGDVRGQVPGSI